MQGAQLLNIVLPVCLWPSTDWEPATLSCTAYQAGHSFPARVDCGSESISRLFWGCNVQRRVQEAALGVGCRGHLTLVALMPLTDFTLGLQACLFKAVARSSSGPHTASEVRHGLPQKLLDRLLTELGNWDKGHTEGVPLGAMLNLPQHGAQRGHQDATHGAAKTSCGEKRSR